MREYLRLMDIRDALVVASEIKNDPANSVAKRVKQINPFLDDKIAEARARAADLAGDEIWYPQDRKHPYHRIGHYDLDHAGAILDSLCEMAFEDTSDGRNLREIPVDEEVVELTLKILERNLKNNSSKPIGG